MLHLGLIGVEVGRDKSLICQGQFHDVNHYYNLEKKYVPPYVISEFLDSNKCLPPYLMRNSRFA